MGTYSLSGISSPFYVSGWVNTAIRFDYFNSQFLTTSYIPLSSKSFTIEFWFYATDLTSTWDFTFGGERESSSNRKCLFLNIRNQILFFGFFTADLAGTTTILINKWYHVAFIYDYSVTKQYIYLNGILDANTLNSALNVITGNFTVGGGYIGGSTSATVYYSGYIDHYTISSRAKSACEIYLDATLACYFTFDLSSSLNDSGPNFLQAVNTGATSVTGRVNEAYQFSSSLSYISINRVTALTSTYNLFTISMWINPTNITSGGTLIHASTQLNGK